MNQNAERVSRNAILTSLPSAEYDRLIPHLKEVRLHKGQVLQESGDPAREVYFLDEGVAAISVSSEEGREVGLSIVGDESLVGERAMYKEGVFVIKCAMLTEGKGYTLSPKAFTDEFERGNALHDLVLNCMEARMTESAQTAMCNQVHSIEQRLVRWLLVFADRLHRKEFELTQEEIAEFLSVRRVGVSEAAGELRKSGLIDYSRGSISITDHEGLKREACECYAIIKDAIETFAS